MAGSVKISRAIPQALVDTNEGSIRGGRYGEQIVQVLHGKKHNLADEGSYFVATSAPGTAIAVTGTITSFLDTGAYGGSLYIHNTESKSNAAAKSIYLDYIKLLVASAMTSATSWEYALLVDDVASRASGGTSITPINPNSNSAVASIATVNFGALTTIAATNRRIVGRGRLSGGTPAVYASAVLVFGSIEGGGMGAVVTTGRSVENAPPVILGPGWNLVLNLWGPSLAAVPTYELECTWWER